MNEYPAGVISANGIDVPIKVTDSGKWEAEINGRTWSYETRDKLEASLKRQTKQATVKVAVPVVAVKVGWGTVSWVRGTLTGIHGANGNVLAVWHHGGQRGDIKEQISTGYGSQSGYFGGDLTDEQLTEYARLVQVAHEADQARRKAEKAYEIRPKDTVIRAIEAQAGSGDDTE